VQCPGDARTVVGIEPGDPRYDVIDVLPADIAFAEDDLSIEESRFGHPSEVQYDLEQVVVLVGLSERILERVGQDHQQCVQVGVFAELAVSVSRWAERVGASRGRLPGRDDLRWVECLI
jgi:hypothetical protein